MAQQLTLCDSGSGMQQRLNPLAGLSLLFRKSALNPNPLIVNSKHEGENIGYPGNPNEIDWFLAMLQKAAPGISDAELKAIREPLSGSNGA
jgi:hypothetical protein